jgi:glucose-1-phosphate cytidylyltransferase
MVQPSDIPVVILAGGMGTRLGEYTEKIPKPMVQIGGLPIIVHIIGLWYKAGHRKFFIAGGYKFHEMWEYFACRDWSFDFPGIQIEVHDTGLETATAGRIRLIPNLLNQYESFGLSYGDGLTDYPLENLSKLFCNSNAGVMMLVTRPISKFGEVIMDELGKRVVGFSEKPLEDKWINAGFFIVGSSTFERFADVGDSFEIHVLPRIVEWGKVIAEKNYGFWHCMDTPKDVIELEELWKGGKAPWL